jgi:pseudouridine-5'-phosphate glycosidase
MSLVIDVHPEVAEALKEKRAVVALETTILTHGLPYPSNLETARFAEEAIRREGAIPATIGVLAGTIKVGFSHTELEQLAKTKAEKLQAHMIPWAVAVGASGGTTVSATLCIAHQVGIRVAATGGIGGVHRQAEKTFDISADLVTLSQTPILLVSAGAKAVLDLPRTLEMLETLSVLVLGFQTSEFPGFYTRTSNLKVTATQSAGEVARIMNITWQGLCSNRGILLANPPPEGKELAPLYVEELIQRAVLAAEEKGVKGSKLTPFLLSFLEKASGGKTVETNIALAESNARLAAQVARAYFSQVRS